MKKILWLLPICFITCGCFSYNKNLVCTMQEPYDEINTDFTVTTYFKKGKISSTKATATMNFDTEEDAKAYFDTYTGDRTNMELNGNLLIITAESVDENEEIQTRKQVKSYFENLGYTCE